MEKQRNEKVSKLLSYILRHEPGAVGLKLEEDGWVKVSDLVTACDKHGHFFTLDELKEIVETSDKKRFSFDEGEHRIRANQGHSADVQIEFEKRQPPAVLYHGTARKNIDAIFTEGLKKMQRHHVHLSSDTKTARAVGIRYGEPVIFEVDTASMLETDFEFYMSTNGVWLIDSVPPQFLKIHE